MRAGLISLALERSYVNLAFIALSVVNHTVDLCKQGVVATTTHVFTGMEVGAALTHQNAASSDSFAREALAAKSLCVGIATIARRAESLLMCHLYRLPNFLEIAI